jgi:small subunit ribosomal protein S1
VKCKVVSVVDYGAFVHVRDGVEGHIPQSDLVLAKDEAGEDKPLHPGDEIEAEIANIDSQERRLTLSMRVGEAAATQTSSSSSSSSSSTEAKPARTSKAPKKAAAAEGAAGGTIGELIKQKLGDKLAGIAEPGKKDDE